MTGEDYRLYREAREATDRLPPASAKAFLEQLAAQNGDSDVVLAILSYFACDRAGRDLAKAICEKLLGRERTAWALAAEAYRLQVVDRAEDAAHIAQEALSADKENPLVLQSAWGIAFLQGSYETALSLAAEMVVGDPDNPEAYGAIVTLHHARHDFDATKKALAEAPAVFVGTSAYHVATGLVARHEGRFSEAIGAFSSATELTPYRPMPWVYLASLNFKLKLIEDAGFALKKALEISPHNGAALSLAVKMAELRRDYRARNRYLALQKLHSKTAMDFGHAKEASRFMSLNMPREALRAYEFMEREGGHLARQFAMEGKLGPLANLGRWKAVEKTLRELGQSPDREGQVRVAQARLLAHSGRIDEAVKTLELALDTPRVKPMELRWLLILASESGNVACLDRVAEQYISAPLERESEMAGVVEWFYAANAYDQGDAILKAVIERFQGSVTLKAIDVWRLRRVGLMVQAAQIRATLPTELQNWEPTIKLRPPRYDPLRELAFQFARRFGIPC